MKKKGFTLIELLAVIVILAIIALIAVPVIMNIISSARKSSFEDTAYGIISAGELYYAEKLLEPNGMTSDAEFTFTNGRVTPTGLNVKGSLPKSGSMVVTKEGKIAIAITNGELCITKGYDDSKIETLEEFESCDLPAKKLSELVKTNDFAESVDACATSGTCSSGTPFAIEVAPGNIQNFYVISDVNNVVTLIMDRNIGNTVAWITQGDYNDDDSWEVCYEEGTIEEWCEYGNSNKGPITALNYLEIQTSGWTNIEAKNYTLTDDNTTPKYTIERTGARARMLTKTEALAVGCSGWYDGDEATCPDWLYGNLDDNAVPWGYWTSFADADTTHLVWFVENDGSMNLTDPEYGYYDGYYYGVRPVIEVSK
ncbi:MAG: prepilin-type N-terminal cleavage/methylation domain-containing protein [Firmicutes bacterium]|nr:prepilin-type N-terminal cleavage/methylation domain-containing protein [Bacillota bacterium]